jgi:hypothetical protein
MACCLGRVAVKSKSHTLEVTSINTVGIQHCAWGGQVTATDDKSQVHFLV